MNKKLQHIFDNLDFSKDVQIAYKRDKKKKVTYRTGWDDWESYIGDVGTIIINNGGDTVNIDIPFIIDKDSITDSYSCPSDWDGDEIEIEHFIEALNTLNNEKKLFEFTQEEELFLNIGPNKLADINIAAYIVSVPNGWRGLSNEDRVEDFYDAYQVDIKTKLNNSVIQNYRIPVDEEGANEIFELITSVAPAFVLSEELSTAQTKAYFEAMNKIEDIKLEALNRKEEHERELREWFENGVNSELEKAYALINERIEKQKEDIKKSHEAKLKEVRAQEAKRKKEIEELQRKEMGEAVYRVVKSVPIVGDVVYATYDKIFNSGKRKLALQEEQKAHEASELEKKTKELNAIRSNLR